MMYELPTQPGEGFWRHLLRRHGWWLGLVLAFDLLLAGCWLARRGDAPADTAQTPATAPEMAPEPQPEPPPPGILLTFPTPQTQLDDTNNPAVYMPTGSGRVESAWYGTTRTRKIGSRYLSAFHEGIDIAAVHRDNRGRALDEVFAVADGRVGYVNRVAGNSSYGIYIVLLHDSDAGEWFTLYAHLASAAPEIREGAAVTRGQTIGRMGHTSTLGIPVQRSHLHFEFGTMLNRRFGDWFRAQKLKPYHGWLHGYNLTGLNPMDLTPYFDGSVPFDLPGYLRNHPPAFRLVVRVDGVPDYYRRHPALWTGDPPRNGAMVMEVSESGAPLLARGATAEEAAKLTGRTRAAVLAAWPEVLGRNGERLVVKRGDDWQLGRKADRWLDILLYR